VIEGISMAKSDILNVDREIETNEGDSHALIRIKKSGFKAGESSRGRI
jgi:hypothetical protein